MAVLNRESLTLAGNNRDVLRWARTLAALPEGVGFWIESKKAAVSLVLDSTAARARPHDLSGYFPREEAVLRNMNDASGHEGLAYRAPSQEVFVPCPLPDTLTTAGGDEYHPELHILNALLAAGSSLDLAEAAAGATKPEAERLYERQSKTDAEMQAGETERPEDGSNFDTDIRF